MKYYTVDEIAESLGVNAASVQRWADSGKLQCTGVDDGMKKFSSDDLTEFAEKYNISIRFLLEPKHKKSEKEIISLQVSAAQ